MNNQDIALNLARGGHGGFKAALGDAFLAADSHNRDRIAKAFPEVFVSDEPQEPTWPQMEALLVFRSKHGRDWKEKLVNAWLDGSDTKETNGHLLRQLRNRLGPTWLYALTLPK